MIPVRMGEEVVYRLLNRIIIFSPDENDLRLISNPDSKKLSKKDIKIAHEQGINERNIIYGVEKGLISLVKYVTPRSGRTQGVQLGLAPLNPEKCLKLLSKYSEFQKLGHNIRLKKPLPTGSTIRFIEEFVTFPVIDGWNLDEYLFSLWYQSVFLPKFQ
eukprot:gnl/Carplike_NY0171/6429_a8834_218.p1 GENE.gnl/Carplike_NY0171/6429_a8834_218~~gnl/Carplike_NY0171/6429_a8834_218.p1  ORF type:complete len:159 (+),score=6.75 gnl/Carplike_NY0171/6429_a8834_218:428-904(+)